MKLGLIYAIGHALTIIGLGAVVIVLRISMPVILDAWAERLTGATLVLLAVAVIASLIKRPHSHEGLGTRWEILISGLRHIWWRVQQRIHPGAPRPAPFAWTYSSRSVFGIGVLHGVGAETPSQLMVFLLAASLGGTANGLLGLLAFAFGLLLMNALMAAGLGGAFGGMKSHTNLRRWAAAAGALYSLAIGVAFLWGVSGRLPPL